MIAGSPLLLAPPDLKVAREAPTWARLAGSVIRNSCDNHAALTICLHAGGKPASVSAGFGLGGIKGGGGCSVDSLNQKSSSLPQPSLGSGGAAACIPHCPPDRRCGHGCRRPRQDTVAFCPGRLEKAQVSRLCRRLRSSSWTDQHRRPSAVTFDSMCMRATRESDRPPSRSKMEPQARWTMRSERQLLGCLNRLRPHKPRSKAGTGARPTPDPQRGVPPCSACHGPGGYKLGAPTLQRQQASYIERQLAAFAQGIRQNAPRADANYRRPAHAGRNARARHVLRHALKRSRRTRVSIAPARTACTRRVL